MPTHVSLASTGEGKTQYAIDTLLQHLQSHSPLTKIWVLVASKRQELAFRERMMGESQTAYFNVEFFNFYELNARLLRSSQNVPPRQVSESARYRLLQLIIEEKKEANELGSFGAIAHTHGFVSLIANFIYELKQSVITPEDFITNSPQKDKDKAIYAIYDRYQAVLQAEGLVDREGEGWLALEWVAQKLPVLDEVTLLLVDGYDNFTPIQAQMLAQLSAHIQRVVVTLAHVSQEQISIGKRFQRALRRLEQAHERYNVPLTRDFLTTSLANDTKPLALRHLSRVIAGETTEQLASSGGHVAFIEADTAFQEVSGVLRQVKRWLVQENVRADDILIAVRDWGKYGDWLTHVARSYGVPILSDYASALANNPLITTLFGVLDLSLPSHPHKSFSKDSFMRLLQSPYLQAFGLSQSEVTALKVRSQDRLNFQGREAWLHLTDSYQVVQDENGDTVAREPLPELRQKLEKVLDALTPPAESTLEDYVAWILYLFGSSMSPEDEEATGSDAPFSLNIPLFLQENSVNTTLQQRDIVALNEFYWLLGNLVQSERLSAGVMKISAKRLIKWEGFLADLRQTVQNARLTERHPQRQGKVLVTSVFDARGLPHQHVVMVGLSEGVFPAPIPEDPLYLDSERAEFQKKGVDLAFLADKSSDDGVFYEIICMARRSVLLSRTALKMGKLWNESYLWTLVKEAFEQVNTTRSNVLTLNAIASHEEALLAYTQQTTPEKQLLEVILSNRTEWHLFLRGKSAEIARRSNVPHNRFSGVLETPALKEMAKQAIGQRFSASKLNELSKCGYYFFAKRLLKIEEPRASEEGIDALSKGTLFHEILEKTYAVAMVNGWFIHPDYHEQAIETLRVVAEELFEKAPQQYRFEPSAFWQSEKEGWLTLLKQVVATDFGVGVKSTANITRKVKALEKKFYQESVSLGEGLFIELNGIIDRIDSNAENEKELVLIDYKTGATPKLEDINAGKNVQLWVYRRAVQQLFPDYSVKLAYFLSIKEKKSQTDADNETDANIRLHLKTELGRIYGAKFPVHSANETKDTCGYCAYKSLCRTAILNKYKTEN